MQNFFVFTHLVQISAGREEAGGLNRFEGWLFDSGSVRMVEHRLVQSAADTHNAGSVAKVTVEGLGGQSVASCSSRASWL